MHTALTLASTLLHLNGSPVQGTIHTLLFALYKQTCEAGIVISVLSMTKQSHQHVPGFGQVLGVRLVTEHRNCLFRFYYWQRNSLIPIAALFTQHLSCLGFFFLFVTLTQPGVIWVEGTSIKNMPSSDKLVGKSEGGIFLNND